MNLRRIVSSAAAVLVLTLMAPASAAAQMVISAGAKVGLNVANVSFKLSGLTVSPKSRTGVVIGGFLAADRKQAGLVVEGLFSQHGTTLEFTQGADSDKQEIRLDYIMFPVLGRVNLKAADGVTVHLYAGPQFGFRTGYENKETLTVGGITTTTTDHDDTGIKGHNIDIAFGGQVDFRQFLVDLRYALGLTDLNADTGPQEPEVKNRTFSIMFGVKLK